MTMNSPESLLELYKVSREADTTRTPEQTAALMREVGLKCISFNGIPRTINMLGAFREGLPKDVARALATAQPPPPSRQINGQNADEIVARGRRLWNSIYYPFEDKLYDKLAASHPNLPVVILNDHYGSLLSDPPANDDVPGKVGRVLTSIVAISALRAQTGVGLQVTSHVFGLRKAYEDGTAEPEDVVQGGRWLASDEGSRWILNCVDEIVHAIGGGQGSTFAPSTLKAKL